MNTIIEFDLSDTLRLFNLILFCKKKVMKGDIFHCLCDCVRIFYCCHRDRFEIGKNECICNLHGAIFY